MLPILVIDTSRALHGDGSGVCAYFPKYASKHKGFLPGFKNCLKAPSAVSCRLLLFRLRERPTLPLPGGNAPSAVSCRLLLFRLRPRPTLPLPVARHRLPRSAVYCFVVCVRALLCPFPVAMALNA